MTRAPLIAAYHEGAPIPFVNHIIIIWKETVIFVRVFTDGTIEQHVGGDTWRKIGKCKPHSDPTRRNQYPECTEKPELVDP
jgi:hypothetical protein